MEKNIPVIVTVNGWSGSGKTTFCESLIRQLTERGFRVAAAKNSHQNLNPDKPGSDSFRFSEAGAAAVCLNALNSMTIFSGTPVAEAGTLSGLFPGADFIIAEGFRSGENFRIEVAGTAESIQEMKNPAEYADLVLYSDERLAGALRKIQVNNLSGGKSFAILHRDQVAEAADLLCGPA